MALGILAVAGMWYRVEGGMDVALIVLAAYTFSPWGFLALMAKSLSDQARGVALGVMVALTVVAYVSTATDESSTGALLFLFVPVYHWATIGVAWLIAAIRESDPAR